MYYNFISMLSIIKNGNVSKASILSIFTLATTIISSNFRIPDPLRAFS